MESSSGVAACGQWGIPVCGCLRAVEDSSGVAACRQWEIPVVQFSQAIVYFSSGTINDAVTGVTQVTHSAVSRQADLNGVVS